MKTIVGERQSGKTTEVIKLALDTGAAVICSNKEAKRIILKRCEDIYGKLLAETLNVFSVCDIIDGKARGRKFNGFVVDEGGYVLDCFIRHFAQPDGFVTQFLTPNREMLSKK